MNERPTEPTAGPTIDVGQVWRSPKLNVFDRTVQKIDPEHGAIYFDCPSPCWGWTSRLEFLDWIKRTRAQVVSAT